MTTPHLPNATAAALGRGLRALTAGLCVWVSACGGGADAPPPTEGGAAPVTPVVPPPSTDPAAPTVPPVLTVTQAPADVAVTAGATASFTVAATCSSGTLAVQWQRQAAGSFADITGATAATYTFTTVAGDTGAQFRAGLSCSGLSAVASGAASLTVSVPSAVSLRYLGEHTRDPARITPTAVVREASGSYVFINGEDKLSRLSADQTAISVVTGGHGLGTADGGPAVAQFNTPQGLAIDAAGTLYVADTASGTIRRVTPDGSVSTLAGLANVVGAANGTGSAARFLNPSGIAIGPDGNLYVADAGNHKIRRVTPAGGVSDVAGTTTAGMTNGPAGSAQFSAPFDVAVAANGDVLVADTGNHRIRRISAAGVVSTLAGSGLNETVNPRNGSGSAADIPGPNHLALSGNTLYVYDQSGQIRAIDLTTAAVTSFAGTPNNPGPGYVDGLPGHAYLDNGRGGITPTGDGGLMIGDRRALRITDAAGRVRSIATNTFNFSGGTSDSTTGVLAQLPFALPVNRSNTLFVDPSGGIVVADNSARSIRRVDLAGQVTLLAGLPGSPAGVVDGVRNEAVFANVGEAVTVAPDGTVYASDNYGVRRIATNGTTTLLAGSSSEFGYADGPAASARFNTIRGLAVAPNGDLLVADGPNQTIRRVDATTGATTTYAGAFTRPRVDGTLATAGFPAPGQLNTAPDGSLWVADGGLLRHIARDGTVTSLSSAPKVRSFAIDTDGTVYVAAAGGLYALPAGATSATAPSLLIPAGSGLSLNPTAPTIGTNLMALALLGHKQLVMIADSRLVVVALP